MNNATEFLAAIGALLGTIAAIMPHLVPWFKNRDKLADDRKKLELAKMEIDFISSWMDAAQAFKGDDIENKRNQAQIRLSRLLESTQLSSMGDEEDSYEPKANLAINITFFAYLGFYLFLLFGLSLTEEGVWSLDELLSEGSIGAMIICGLPLIALYFWRRRSKQKDAAQHKAKQLSKEKLA